MRRDQLEHAIRTACQIIHQSEVIVVGSQAILGTYDESQLPTAETMSIEVAGEFSPFEELHGFSIDGVDLDTAVLPDGSRTRLVKVQNANTAAPAGEPRFTGWRLDKEDLCVAKLIALREKTATSSPLLDAGLVNPDLIAMRLSTVAAEHPAAPQRALAWLDSAR